MTLVDTNILLDIVVGDPLWLHSSLFAIDAAAAIGPIFINDIVYAEISVRYSSIADVDTFVDETGLELIAIPRPALFLAGKVFSKYRKAGGTRTGVLPDFFIGAHAAVSGWTLLTRDTGRYRIYFSQLDIISPQTSN